jgi:hypothetical protein
MVKNMKHRHKKIDLKYHIFNDILLYKTDTVNISRRESTLVMDITVFFNHTYITKDLGIDDVACLKCVCKAWNKELDKLYMNKDDELSVITALSLGMKMQDIDSEHLLDMTKFVKSIVMFRNAIRYTKKTNSNAHILRCTKDFTLNIAKKLLKDVRATTSTKQKATCVLLLNLFEEIDCVELKIHIVFILFYFMNKLIKRNQTAYVKQGDCMFSSRRFRKVIIAKCTQLIEHMRDELTCYPYSFIDKVMRVCAETRRQILSI